MTQMIFPDLCLPYEPNFKILPYIENTNYTKDNVFLLT